MSEPKVFISYSWSSQSHERWVLDLAEELIESGINVILDKWDLKPGQDSIDFMEQMVKDPSIDKVLIVSDKAYAEKADNRSGGVGTETQIISKKVYEQVDQERFIAVIAEKDAEGKAYTPLFYHSRLYIDLSEPDRYAEGFESLIRCIHGQPQFKKPALGKKPDYLNSEASINLGTSALFKRAISAIRDQKPFAVAALDEYLVTFSDNMEQIRIIASPDEMFDDCVVNSIQLFVPVRNELLQVVDTSCRYIPQDAFVEVMHKFLESLTKYFTELGGRSSYKSSDFDNYKFIINEIFIYTITILIKHKKFQAAAEILNNNYYIKSSSRGIPYLASCHCFYENPESLDYRNTRLNLSRMSLSADITKENNNGTGIEFNLLMQTDFILFIRNSLDKSGFWWPKTLVYLGHFPGAFELFNRATSEQYFEKIKALLNIESKLDLTPLIEEQKKQGTGYYQLGHGFQIKQLLNFDDLCTAR